MGFLLASSLGRRQETKKGTCHKMTSCQVKAHCVIAVTQGLCEAGSLQNGGDMAVARSLAGTK